MRLARLAVKTVILVLFLAAVSSTFLQAQQQEPTPAGGPLHDHALLDKISFHFERPGLAVPHYQLEIAEDGTGSYDGEELPMSDGQTNSPFTPQSFTLKTLHITPITVTKIFTLARRLNYFNISCASTARNIADTGKKTLDYKHSGSDHFTGSCTYNYTENREVQTLTDIFQGIAETLDEGRKLDYLHRYDRLGLDAELENFTNEVVDGHAIELQVIAETLNSLAGDPDVIQRVRTRASALLTTLPRHKN